MTARKLKRGARGASGARRAKGAPQRCLVCYEPTAADASYHPRCARALFGTSEAPILEVTADDVERLAMEVVNQRLALTGVQRKLSLSLAGGSRGTGPRRLTIVGVLGGTHILKPPTPEYPNLPEIEDLTMSLAQVIGIQIVTHGLIRAADGALAYITRRFDRERGKKLAVEDLCQLSEKPTAAKYRSSAEKTGKIISRYSSNPGADVLRYFELTLFSFVSGNADMHLKNFSMITAKDGLVGLSPAYDLVATRLVIPERSDPEELALPVNGRKRKLTRADFLALGASLKIPAVVVDRTFARFGRAAPKLQAHINKSSLMPALQREYRALVAARLNRLGI